MSEAKKYFKRSGGISLLKQYWRAGVFFPALFQFILLGRSKKALELLRLTVTLKTQHRLKKKYGKVLKSFVYDESLEHIASRKVWIFWWQGMESAPGLVQRCYSSVKENLIDWEIVLITQDNYKEYVTFPEHILQRLENGEITLTHFSDLLRLELLINHGGLWLDATVLCTSSAIPQSIIDSDLFVHQALKPGADGHATVMSSWCIYAKTNNKILLATREMLYQYWQKNTKLVDYFLLHQFFTIVCNHFPEDAKQIPPFSNSVPHILLLRLFEQYDERYWNDLKRMTCFHKLSYKFDAVSKVIEGTYYDKFFN